MKFKHLDLAKKNEDWAGVQLGKVLLMEEWLVQQFVGEYSPGDNAAREKI